ncbi:hypothetical protein D918_06571 [Trichuris suis]|nr:hypothetical protein D918_06571 [Trichuris suis]
MFLKRRILTVFDFMFPRGTEALVKQRRQVERTSRNCVDRRFQIGDKVRVGDYMHDRNTWCEGIIAGERGQVVCQKRRNDVEETQCSLLRRLDWITRKW